MTPAFSSWLGTVERRISRRTGIRAYNTPMGISLQIPAGSPWRTVFRVCLLLLSEGAVIALLRDAPLSFLAATAVIPLLGVVLLETEEKFSAGKRWLFVSGLGILALAYGCFVGYAIIHASDELAIGRTLDSFRSEGLVLQNRPSEAGMNAFEYSDWQKRIEQWRVETAKYLSDNVGDAAKNRFLNVTGRMSFNYGNASPQLNHEINMIDWLGKNLQDIIDSRGHSK
jgi:hypothetical protein